MSTLRFGFSSSSRPTRPRSSAAQPTWAPTNVVRGWRATSRPKAASSSSNGGNPGASGSPAGRVGQKCQSGWAWSSSQRSFVGSSGSKKAIGSAMWMTTGRSSSAAAVPERVEARVVDRDEAAVGIARPQAEQLPDLEPARSPRGGVPQPGRLRLPERRVGGPAVVVEAGEDRDPIRIRRLPSLDLRRERVALAAVQVDDHLDARRVEGRDQLGRRTRRPVATECRPEVVVRIDDGILRLPNLVNRNAERRPRPEIGEAEVVSRHSGPRMTTWPRCRGASGSQPRVSARDSASAWAGWTSSGRRAEG